VATDDERIAAHGRELGVDVAMTPPISIRLRPRLCGGVRARAPPAFVVNLQGDAPFTPAAIVAGLLDVLRQRTAAVVTPVFQLDWPRLDRLRAHKRTAPFSGTTCVRAPDGRALWFSKTILPALRGEDGLRAQPLSPVWQHLGLYGYSFPALEWFASARASQYEKLEGLEQLRFLEHGWAIDTIAVDVPPHVLSGSIRPKT
jgi:3-deoxy-manno-octulosonate cytidylyltransferase (CMP-KDO synthetase)